MISVDDVIACIQDVASGFDYEVLPTLDGGMTIELIEHIERKLTFIVGSWQTYFYICFRDDKFSGIVQDNSGILILLEWFVNGGKLGQDGLIRSHDS